MLGKAGILQATLALAGSLLLAPQVQALGLGDITLDSRLNEPLAASVELLDLAGLAAEDIQVSLAGQAEYERVGIERDAFVSGIRFEVVRTGATGEVRLTSTDNVVEPYLNLIITANWPGGTLVREYTLLLDLPTFSESQPALSESQPALSEARPAQPAPATTTPAPAVTPAPASATAPRPVPAGNTNTGSADAWTVGNGDTLWDIATATRPDASVSVQQMMLALQRANPDAFIGGNINRIINGRVLRIPDRQEIGTIDQDAAIAQVNQQNAALGVQPLAGPGTTTGATVQNQDQLTVLSGDDLPTGAGSSDLEATIAALEMELMLSEENLDRARIENEELTTRLGSLQEQIDLLENIIAIEDERIAQLQAELAEEAAATARALAAADSADASLNELDAQPQGLAGQLTQLLQNSLVLLGSGLGLVLVVLGYLVMKRRKAEAEAQAAAYAFDPALDTDLPQERDTDIPAGASAGFLAGLMARFRRGQADEDEDEDFADEDFEDDEVMEDLTEAAAPEAPRVKPAQVQGTSQQLMDEMGISEDMLSLDDALDDVDETDADAATPVADMQDMLNESVAEPDLDADTGSLDDALDEVEEIEEVEEAEDAAPDTFEFTLRDSSEPQAEAEDVAAAAIESLDFTLSPATAPAGAADEAVPEEGLDVVSFTPAPVDKPDTEEPVESQPASDLYSDEITFDDTLDEAEVEEESVYTPRTGNECDTKLDLATAYEAMGDVADAIEILDEVIAEGSPAQVETAQRLKASWQSQL